MNILLTGDSKGIGKGIKEALREQGHRVIGLSRSNPDNDSDHVEVDFDTGTVYQAIYMHAREKLGIGTGILPDILINNAGVCFNLSVENEPNPAMWQYEWERMFRINMTPAVCLTHCFVHDLLHNKKGGRVINIGSRVGHRGDPESPHYAASKAALMNFTKSMAVHYANRQPELSLFSVSPCWVETDMANKPMEHMIRDIPMGRIVKVEEVVKVVSFLVNDAPHAMTGQDIPLTGASYFP